MIIECNGFHFSRDLARPCDQRFTWLYEEEPFKVSHHPAKFDGQRQRDIGDIMVSGCQMITKDVMVSGC